MVICIRHVKFTSGELRVMSHVDALVPELATDFIHSVYATDHKHLRKRKKLNLEFCAHHTLRQIKLMQNIYLHVEMSRFERKVHFKKRRYMNTLW